MSQLIQQRELPVAVERVLGRVRRAIRAYVWVQGLATVVVVLGMAFWAGLLWDWLLEPSPDERRMAVFVVVLAAATALYRYLVRRAFVSLPDASLAVLMERRYSELADHVLTAVDMASPSEAGHYHPELVERTRRAAEEAVGRVRVAGLFDRGPLVRTVVSAVVLAASIGGFALAAGDTFDFWLGRIGLSAEPWPRRVHLEVVGFPPDAAGRRTSKLAQDDDFELLVHASTDGFVAPDEVEVRFRLADGRRGRDTMTRVGQALPGRDQFQLFRYQFKRVSGDMTLEAAGGDDRVGDLRLHVVDRPELVSIELECIYPGYLEREPRRLPVTGGMRIPEGTRLVLHAMSTKPLVEARIHTTRTPREELLQYSDGPSNTIQWRYGTLSADDALLVTCRDVDGVECRDPYRVSLAVVPDEIPQVAVRLSGIGSAVTPDAVIRFVGRISDDYGLDRAWFEYQVDGQPLGQQPFAHQPTARLSEDEIDSFDLQPADDRTTGGLPRLEPGQKLGLAVKATDQYDLADKPRAGSSQQFVLEVVTPDQLLAQLERQELSLRQRFEAICDKLLDTRNLLARVEFDDAAGDRPSARPQPPDAGALARRRLRVAGSLQNVVQSAHEITDVAEAFDDIHDQIVNNRIDNDDLKGRLHNDIALPLRQIGQVRMTELEAQLRAVDEHIEDAAGPPALAASIRLADEILVEMQQVLDRMLELETYNEVVSQLRGIISDQEEINRRTKEMHKQRLRNLFEQ
jgi:hypothetical protein